MKRRYLLALWLLLLCVFGGFVNTNKWTGDTETFFTTKTPYNYEFKRGFPIPWLSDYYAIPRDTQVLQAENHDDRVILESVYRVHRDISLPNLAVIAIIAAMPVMALYVFVRIYKFVRKRK